MNVVFLSKNNLNYLMKADIFGIILDFEKNVTFELKISCFD